VEAGGYDRGEPGKAIAAWCNSHALLYTCGMPMNVSPSDVRPWLEEYLRWEAKAALAAAAVMAPLALLVCAIQYGLADGLLCLFLCWFLPKWLLHLAALGALALLFVGSARMNPGYLNDIRFLLGKPAEEAYEAEAAESVKMLAPGEAHPAAVALTWALFTGPELVRRAICGFARHRRLTRMDREDLAAALACLASADRAADLEEVERAAPGAGAALVPRLKLVRGVLFIGQSEPFKVGLTAELRRTLRHGDAGATDC